MSSLDVIVCKGFLTVNIFDVLGHPKDTLDLLVVGLATDRIGESCGDLGQLGWGTKGRGGHDAGDVVTGMPESFTKGFPKTNT